MLTQAQRESSSALLRHTEEDREEWQDTGLLSNSPPAPFAQTEQPYSYLERRKGIRVEGHKGTLLSNTIGYEIDYNKEA